MSTGDEEPNGDKESLVRFLTDSPLAGQESTALDRDRSLPREVDFDAGPQAPPNLKQLGPLIDAAKGIAKQYRALTGRPLGITGEVAEYEAARLLGLDLAEVRQAGYDAIRRTGQIEERLQVKGRCVLSNKPGQRLGRIDLDQEWDTVLVVLLDADLDPIAIYEAPRAIVRAALQVPGSKARNERGALSVSKFKSIGRQVWPVPPG